MHAINKIVQDVLNENLIERINFYRAVQAKVKQGTYQYQLILTKQARDIVIIKWNESKLSKNKEPKGFAR